MPFPINPKTEFFSRPDDLEPGYGTVVTDEGHIYGYLALWDSRFINGGRGNQRPPKSKSNYSYANAFNTKCEDGSIVRTGVLAGEGGHHFRGGFQPSQAAYADVKHKIARVVYGEDKHGVWFSGALCPDVDEATVEQIRSSGVSGHWERPASGRPLELLGACLVNIPGFAQSSNHRIAASASFTPSGGITISPALASSDPAGEPSIPVAGKNFQVQGAGNSIAAGASRLIPVEGVLAALNTRTVDGRQVNNVQWDRLPMPLWYLGYQNMWGHEGAVIVGSITDIRVEGNLVMFKGMMDEGLEGTASAEAVANLNTLGISMDGMPDPDSEISYELDEYGWPEEITFELYNIHGGTLCMDPAFRETFGVTAGEDTGDDTTEEPTDTEEDTTDESSGIAASATPECTTIKPPIIWH